VECLRDLFIIIFIIDLDDKFVNKIPKFADDTKLQAKLQFMKR